MTDKTISENEFYKWLGKRLRELREKAGIKQKELAEKSGVNAPFISRVENSGKKISAYQINKILTAMGYTQADLLDEEGKKKITLTLNGDSLTRLSNGERREFLEKLKLSIKLLFSQELLTEIAREMQAEEDRLRRDAALQHAKQPTNGECLNHC